MNYSNFSLKFLTIGNGTAYHIYIYTNKNKKNLFVPSKSFSVHEWIFKIFKLELNNFMHDNNMNGIEHPPKCKLDSVLF